MASPYWHLGKAWIQAKLLIFPKVYSLLNM
jgi:hypothetical protein